MKTTKFFFTSFLVLFITYNQLLGQQTPSDYVLKEDGAKVYGTIPRDFDFNQAKTIKFIDLDGQESVYRPQDISGFGLSNGRLFISRAVSAEEAEDLVFFQLILKGKISLYSYNNQFYIDNGIEFLELMSEYGKRDVEGRLVTTFKKRYLGILSYMMKGSCNLQLQRELSKTTKTESGLIKILMLYHNCEGIPFQLLVEEIPVFRVSMVGSVGFSGFQNSPGVLVAERQDAFDKNAVPTIKFGLKLDQIRRMPRFAIDVSVGYSRWNTVVNSEFELENHSFTGTEDFVRTAISVPLLVDYIFLRSPMNEYYIGGGASLMFNRLSNGFGITDLKSQGEPSEILLQESRLMHLSSAQLAPVVKLGGHFRFKERLGFVTELQLEHYADAYSVHLGRNEAHYNQSVFSLLFGLRF